MLIGLVILAAGSMWWIKQTTLENRLNLMRYLADETADRVVQQNGNIGFDKFFNRMLDDRSKLLELNTEPRIFIADLEGNVLFSRPPQMKRGLRPPSDIVNNSVPPAIIDNKDSVQRLQMQGMEDVYSVKSPIIYEENQVGWVVLMQDAADLTDVNQEYRLLIIMLIGLGLLGWVVIFILSKKISKPIQEVARAASQIREGNYEIVIDSSAKEHEIDELIHSFKEMSSRLMHLETLRTELLAGVTHDLKTPVTAISGLVQAVRDGVVTGDERHEFLDITLKEVNRLQTMIADLLDFNSLSAGAFCIRLEECNMNQLIQEIVREWAVTQNKEFAYKVSLPDQTIYRTTDPLRLQQIMINLLNNSLQAMDERGTIIVTLSEQSIDVKDTGTGIPADEQPYVFERFFRGSNKKLKVRGLGLSLPFSKMLAKVLKADLVLKESSHEGTTFSIVWTTEG
ncbi:sensor histidine kinase [Bacillus sp. V3-13]|nr:sensor histidine kinase [Bacillus sp. V3-13]